MSQQWIWMSLAASTLALGSANAQVDPNSAAAITTSQPNPGAPAGTPAASSAGSPIGNPYTEPLGDPTGAANPGIGGSGTSTGAVIPQPYSAQPFVAGTAPSTLPPGPGTSTTVTGNGTVVAPGTSTTVTGTGAVLPGTSGTVAGSTGSTATTGALMPPATTTPGTMLPGASNSTVTPGTPTGTTSDMGVVLPPATGLTPPGITGSQPTTLSPDSNTSSNSVTSPGGGDVTRTPVGP
ncbi:hypothetical protein [Corallococcus exercitus]|uniref:Uncharacterized protein n=1 Tax=Corallococcus exercitus TaxID=2316736 RepID=A0A7Y4JWL4_9BACT|nr:hypothetical protein [Corallococcus exercitus]NOK12538.1 hypothetical protein [Corallococcus exercitus]